MSYFIESSKVSFTKYFLKWFIFHRASICLFKRWKLSIMYALQVKRSFQFWQNTIHTADNALLTSKLSIIHLALLSPFAACVTTSVSLWKMTENGPWSLSGFCRSSCGQDNIWLLEYMDIDMCNEWVTFIPENIKQVCVMVLRMKQRYPWSSG